MGTAKFLISTELLRKALELPEGVEILGEAGGNMVFTARSDLIPEGVTEVLPTWIKEGDTVTFKEFSPCKLPSFPEEVDHG